MELVEIEELFKKIEYCSSDEEVYRIWEEANLRDDCFMLAIGESSNINFSKNIYNILSRELVCSYFQSNKIRFVHNKVIRNSKTEKLSKVPADYSLMFDSNICTYINAVMERKAFNGSKEIIPLLLDILHNRIMYDFTFYLYENFESINIDLCLINKDFELWDLLNADFQKNLINLIKFKHIKPEGANSFETSISDIEAKEEAIELCFKVYFQANDLLKNIITKFKMTKMIVLKIVEIQFSSNKSTQNKYLELIKFMNEKYCFSDRESILALEYFKNKNLGTFKKIHHGMKFDKFLKRVNNVSWDIMAPRIMEDFIRGMSSHEEVFIPFFFSYDENLRETIKAHPIKYLFLNGDDNKRRVVSIPKNNTHEYLYKNNCHKAIEEIFNNTEFRRKNVSNIQLNLDENLINGFEECKKILELG